MSKNQQKNALKPILMGNGGNGLWCYAPEKKEKELKNNNMQKIEKKTENSMLDFLEKKCSELTIEIEQEKAKCKLSNLEVIQLKNGIESLNKVNEMIYGLKIIFRKLAK